MDKAQIEAELSQHGVRVVDTQLPTGTWGLYSKQRGLVLISARLTAKQRHATLLHELIHVRRGDDGHQNARTERAIDRVVALMLIRDEDYRQAEALHGPIPYAIAAELDVPVWGVSTYQNTLERYHDEGELRFSHDIAALLRFPPSPRTPRSSLGIAGFFRKAASSASAAFSGLTYFMCSSTRCERRGMCCRDVQNPFSSAREQLFRAVMRDEFLRENRVITKKSCASR